MESKAAEQNDLKQGSKQYRQVVVECLGLSKEVEVEVEVCGRACRRLKVITHHDLWPNHGGVK